MLKDTDRGYNTDLRCPSLLLLGFNKFPMYSDVMVLIPYVLNGGSQFQFVKLRERFKRICLHTQK